MSLSPGKQVLKLSFTIKNKCNAHLAQELLNKDLKAYENPNNELASEH